MNIEKDFVEEQTVQNEEIITFEDLGLDDISLAAIEAKGFEHPTPIQILAIPRLLDGDANVVAKARTGTGKTAAFGLPLLQKIRTDKGHVQALVLTPTRELALQVCKEMQSLTESKFPRMTAVYGGQYMSEQTRKLKSGVEIAVGTPGRVKDHIERGNLRLEHIDYFILDEADEMLDMGFIDDIEFIFSKAPETSRVLLFSATMPSPILKIAAKFMGDYEIVEEEVNEEEPKLTEQRYWFVREGEKVEALVRLIDISTDFYGLIFTQTKIDADTIAKELDERGYEAAAMHGDIAQAQREKILLRFRKKKTRILVATDVAARGIDIEGLTHVVNYAMPFDGQTYVHRIGRTGRAGASGKAFTFVRPEERRKVEYLKNISKGSLKEGAIPSIEEVLKVKRERVFEELKVRISQVSPKDAELFSDFAHDLCGITKNTDDNDSKSESNKSPVKILAAVLADEFKDTLSTERYGNISVFSQGTSKAGKNQTRIYVGLGRRDNMSRPEIARFFADLLRIPNRLVDNIEVTENFSLVSLPTDVAEQAIELSQKDKRLPHMHIDVKSGGGRGGSFGRSDGNRSEGGRGGESRGRRERSGKDSNSRKSSGNSELREKTSNASLYKKKKPLKKEQFF